MDGNAKRNGELLNPVNGGVAAQSLDVRNISPVELCVQRKRFLTESSLTSQANRVQ